MPRNTLTLHRDCVTWNDDPVECPPIERGNAIVTVPEYLIAMFLKKVQKYMPDDLDLPKDACTVTVAYEDPTDRVSSLTSVRVDRRRRRR